MKSEGYSVHLYFLWIPDHRLAIKRIKERVRRGGHNIPTPVVRRRFHRALHNLFEIYYDLADFVMILDNSASKPKTIAEKKNGKTIVRNSRLFAVVRREAKSK